MVDPVARRPSRKMDPTSLRPHPILQPPGCVDEVAFVGRHHGKDCSVTWLTTQGKSGSGVPLVGLGAMLVDLGAAVQDALMDVARRADRAQVGQEVPLNESWDGLKHRRSGSWCVGG